MWGRRLNGVERNAYDVLPDDMARAVRIVAVPSLPGGYAGLTLGPVVLLARPVAADGTSALLAHELVHVRQWRELGAVGFVVRYLMDFASGVRRHRRWTAAYRDIGLERQARSEADQWRLRRVPSRGERGEVLP